MALHRCTHNQSLQILSIDRVQPAAKDMDHK